MDIKLYLNDSSRFRVDQVWGNRRGVVNPKRRSPVGSSPSKLSSGSGSQGGVGGEGTLLGVRSCGGSGLCGKHTVGLGAGRGRVAWGRPLTCRGLGRERARSGGTGELGALSCARAVEGRLPITCEMQLSISFLSSWRGRGDERMRIGPLVVHATCRLTSNSASVRCFVLQGSHASIRNSKP